MGRIVSLALLGCALSLAGCSYPIRNVAITDSALPEYSWSKLPPLQPQDTLVIVTASGGGTRASALAMAALKAMDRVRLPSGKSLADKIDVLSSVSGGSVTAAYFALYGSAGLPTLEQNFIRQDGMSALIGDALNPIGLVTLSTPSKERIDLLIDYLDKKLFANLTFEELMRKPHRPYLILNAADMVEGTPFPFTQYTMDLLCSDLSSMKISTAVAASAAFPVALSPVTLKNYRPCQSKPVPGWLQPASQMDWYLDPPRVAWQRTAGAYADGRKKYVHLLDGGIADNIGVSEPYRLLTGDDLDVRFKFDIAQGHIKKLIFVMVNARSFVPSDLDQQHETPGMGSMLLASINSAIDRTTFNAAERLRSLLLDKFRGLAADFAHAHPAMAENFRTVAANTQFISIDFDAIADPDCRRRFHSIPTTWALSDTQIDALNAVGEALFAEHHDFPIAVKAVQGHVVGQLKTLAEACTLAAKIRQ